MSEFRIEADETSRPSYTIFVAENLEAFISSVTNGKTSVDIKWLILAQMVVFLPLSLVRNLAKLSGTALIADAFILIGRACARLAAAVHRRS